MDVPASLRHRIELFAETGRVFRIPNELFAENSWIQVMLGQGITPRQRHPVPNLMGDDELNHFLPGRHPPHVDNTVARLPAHGLHPELLRDEERGGLTRSVSTAVTRVSSTCGLSTRALRLHS